MTADCELRFLLGRLRGKQNLSGISARPGNGASWTGGAHVTLKRYPRVKPSETKSPLSAYTAQIFVARVNVAYAIISKEQRAGPGADRTGED